MLGKLLASFDDLLVHIAFLTGVIASLLLLLAISFKTTLLQFIFHVYSSEKLKLIRRYVSIFILLFATTLIYLIIDTHLARLPDPIILYGFYILGFTILFGMRSAVLASVLSVLLIEYYLYEPRYTLSIIHHPINLLYIIFVVTIGMFLGQKIRRYQQKLLKRTEDLDLIIKARDQFSAIAVHELKTPLTTISLYSQVLSKQYKNDTASKVLQDSVKTITRETDKLNFMINDLLDFSRLQSNKFKLNSEFFNLAELCRDRVEIAHSLYPDHMYTFVQRTKNSTIYADRLSIDRVITNLLTNAGKYSSFKSKVVVTLQKKKSEFILRVKDKGNGIDNAHIDKLFEPFYQVENGKKGLGLGLHIAKSIVEMHKGKIWAESIIGKGSAFFVSLPANSPSSKRNKRLMQINKS